MSERTVTTTGVGQVRTEPEFAKITVKIRTEEDSAREARELVRDRTAAVVDSLITCGIDESAIRRVNIQLGKNADIFDESPVHDYEAKEKLVVRCGLELTSDAIVAANDAGASVEYVEYGFTEDRRERLKQRAISAAMETSRSRAGTIAQTSGDEIGDVLTVTSSEVASDGMQGLVDDALEFTGGPELHPGELTVSATVEACYRLE